MQYFMKAIHVHSLKKAISSANSKKGRVGEPSQHEYTAISCFPNKNI